MKVGTTGGIVFIEEFFSFLANTKLSSSDSSFNLLQLQTAYLHFSIYHRFYIVL
jgi:hypothetical protein